LGDIIFEGMALSSIPSISPVELSKELGSPTPPKILDVREPEELEISRLPELVHIPLGELPERIGELDAQADWVVVCRSGGRSGQATGFLISQGFKRVRNMETGMNGYAQTVDASLPVY
jgi:rhodanese-related sulfurtransferase